MNNPQQKKIIAPSLLSADFSKLAEQVREIEQAGIHWLHWDIMDGHFVPNLSMGPAVVQSLRPYSSSLFDCHLMVQEPAKWIKPFVLAGAQLLTIHLETLELEPLENSFQLLEEVRSLGAQVGISIKPNTPVSSLIKWLPKVDLILLMSVEPGFSGQTFLETTYDKVKELNQLREQLNLSFLIQVDGGLHIGNAKALSDLRVNIFVFGSAIFSAKNPKDAILEIKEQLF